MKHPIPLFKLATVILTTILLAALSACSLTPTQQNVAVKVAASAVSRIDKNGKLAAEEKDIIKRGVLAATSPKDRSTDALVTAASAALNAAVKRGAVEQQTANDIDTLLALASLAF